MQDTLFILPCLNELRWTKAGITPNFDKENAIARPLVQNGFILVNQKISSLITNTPIATYNGILENRPCDHSDIWVNITNVISNKDQPCNLIISSHHNVMRKQILKSLFQTMPNMKIANASCFRIFHEESSWKIQLIHPGFTDNQSYTYYNNTNQISQFNQIPENIHKQTQIFIMRHGNSMHNKPLNFKGINRTIDTNLTPLGIWQARQTGNTIRTLLKNNNNQTILIASQLNRAQHTALEIFKKLPTKLNKIQKIFSYLAIRRLARKLTNTTIQFKQNNTFNSNTYSKLQQANYTLAKSIGINQQILNEITNNILTYFCNTPEKIPIQTLRGGYKNTRKIKKKSHRKSHRKSHKKSHRKSHRKSRKIKKKPHRKSRKK